MVIKQNKCCKYIITEPCPQVLLWLKLLYGLVNPVSLAPRALEATQRGSRLRSTRPSEIKWDLLKWWWLWNMCLKTVLIKKTGIGLGQCFHFLVNSLWYIEKMECYCFWNLMKPGNGAVFINAFKAMFLLMYFIFACLALFISHFISLFSFKW